MADAPWILGVSYSHNGAACLLRGDEIIVAIQEERVSGIKRARIVHHADSLAVRYCLDHAGLAIGDVDLVVACAFSGTPVPAPASDVRRFLAIPHHLGHAHAVFTTSGFDDAAILIIDGQGGTVDALPAAERANVKRGVVPGQQRETEVISIYRAAGDELRCVEKHAGEFLPGWTATRATAAPRSLPAFGSLGGMYSAAADLIFGDPLEAGKVMGLAPYGRPAWPVEAFLTLADDGCVHYADRVAHELRDLLPWPANQELFANLAASVQAALEHAVLAFAARACRIAGSDRLCYAGGVALNSVANELVHTRLGLADVYVMPAAEDSGAAIGAAYHGYQVLTGRLAKRRLAHDSVGRTYVAADIERAIASTPCIEPVATTDAIDAVVDRLCAGEIVGWFEGGSELGPRALGQRTILCDARRADGKARLNDRVKHRESFRPFAPAILLEETAAWFETSPEFRDSPAMLRVLKFRPGRADEVPAAAHVDGTGRVQTVTAAANPGLHALLRRFQARTGVPILVNTSFNVAGEPIVESPEDALWCLLATDIDAVVLEGRLVRKADGYRSLLQLSPRLRARELRVAFPIADGALRLKLPDARDLQLVTPTRYGELAHGIRPQDAAMFALCDGTRTGADVLAMLRRAQPDLDEAIFVRRLAYYRRTHALALTAR